MFETNILENTVNRCVTERKGIYSVLEYNRDMSLTPLEASNAYFCSKMGVRRRQVIAKMNGSTVILQAGAMQMMIGNITAETNIQGAGDLFKKAFTSKVTGESAIKPKYSGSGELVLEPTYKHILLEDLNDWGGGLVIDDGLFLACDASVELTVAARSNLSSAALGGEGLFNTCLRGKGIAVLESPVPRAELMVIDLRDDTAKIDGNMAIAWSDTLQFTVERTTKTLIGSAASGEGLVNVYRGTGRILIATV